MVRELVLAVVLLAATNGCGGGGGDGGKSDASLLEDTPWVLVSGDGIELPDGASPSATFSEGRMAGSTGCNRYSAPYTLDGDRLELGAAITTKIACLPPLDS